MSGFDKDWLTLREPVDLRARDENLMAVAMETVAKARHPVILDIGCGTGSTFRALSSLLQKPAAWRLLDNDPRLLEEAMRLHGDAIETIQGDLNDIDSLPLSSATLVTASALFDLCSQDFIKRFAEKIAQADIGLYAALNYDGAMHWSKFHPLDEVVTANFNAHQLSDKGFGPALGPEAWKSLAAALEGQGYAVKTAESRWIMTSNDAELQTLFLNGIVRAVLEYGELDEAEIRDWSEFRHRMIERDDSLCRVGHQDVLALR
ncbi:class I SAM-dependent methyltransferase [Rhizobium sp. XQZ8]|uniref:class I SAM-dependent methyltransferase n=1 Tax=Rhizobium populisoli TaxID=2859785 RepID=UPI001C670DF6|nr:class I SAM-dependent methyltransferase [Rhizobium populisoli]MBW6424472.1 class I SAM-dependent methyltransferase [Rhizobium populisoli]